MPQPMNAPQLPNLDGVMTPAYPQEAQEIEAMRQQFYGTNVARLIDLSEPELVQMESKYPHAVLNLRLSQVLASSMSTIEQMRHAQRIISMSAMAMKQAPVPEEVAPVERAPMPAPAKPASVKPEPLPKVPTPVAATASVRQTPTQVPTAATQLTQDTKPIKALPDA